LRRAGRGNGDVLALEIRQRVDLGLGQNDLRHARPGAADDLDAGAARGRHDGFGGAHIDAVDLTRDQRLHQRIAGFDLQQFDLQSALGAEAALVDHGDEAGIALGFKDAMLPDLFLRVASRKAADQH